ncbi:SpoIIE family protein phosphatase [Oscillatoria salina]|uniref:SpoIIE family protein phosphatase n=1 Tax=Oscillatoria salina TaxID=331517 RepID=UPI0013B8D4A0|nr:SpoIIE family protein phosphatase [Oscillatoria salina]MBZ8179791.1 SpoIIE family protein phosphatase [Oscillatoria salina IIICB1]NET87698.1 SpoIIE family protein phosphatase [Kamptonema sp. SIO1D9]
MIEFLSLVVTKISRKVPLRTTLVIPFVLQIVAAVGLVGYLSLRSAEKAVNDLASQLHAEVTNRVEERLRNYLAVPHAINHANADALSLGQLSLNDFSELELHFWQQIQRHPETSYIYVGTEEEIFSGAEQVPGKLPNVAYWTGESPNGEFETYATEKKGSRTKLLSVVPGYDLLTRPWYQAAKDAEKPVWGEIYVWAAPYPNLALPAVRPVYNSEAELEGVFAVDLSLLAIADFLSTLEIGKTGKIFIMERNGLLISSSTGNPPFLSENNQQQRLPASESKSSLIQATVEFLEQKFQDFQHIDTPQQLSFRLDGSRQLLQVTPYQDEFGLDWLIVVVVPESDFMAEINQNTRITILLCVVALIVAVGIGIITARWITQPIHRVSQASEKIANGELEQHVEAKGSIELEKLAASFNQMAGQLKELIENLEDKVKSRTAQLAQANQEITILYKRLKAENVRLSAELDLLRQMQHLILPKPAELKAIKKLDIAGYMEPAEEVGGDYYDVLHTDGVVTIGIGDVTGHGLESGILMVMTQTAVRTLQEIRETDPVKFLNTLNRTIYQNIQRMNSDKNLTLVILNYFDGKLSISGQHEETIIVRSHGEIERIDTIDLGFPIGLEPEIADFIARENIQLNLGDLVVLYTDGITEAEDVSGVHYGLERLCEVIQLNRHYSAEEIKQVVIDDLRKHIGLQKMFDDLTLVILKQQ